MPFLALRFKRIQCLYFSIKNCTGSLMLTKSILEHVKRMCLCAQWQSSLPLPFVLEPPKPFNLTLYTLKDNLKFLNVLWFTFGNPDFFNLFVCKLESMCYEKIIHYVTENYSIINQWNHQMNMSLETGRHKLYIESHSRNISVTSTTEFIIGKNLQSF